MSSYQVCPTCGDPFSVLIMPYTKDMKDLCEEFSIDHERISSQPVGDNEFNERKKKIMNKYVGKHRPCCRMRLSNLSDIVRLVH